VNQYAVIAFFGLVTALLVFARVVARRFHRSKTGAKRVRERLTADERRPS
jgi:hypothetical protein